MIITSGTPHPSSQATASSEGSKAVTKDSQAPKAAPSQRLDDSVTLSQTATQASAVDGASVVDSERVEHLKRAIEDGSYSVDPDAIAQKMLAQDALF